MNPVEPPSGNDPQAGRPWAAPTTQVPHPAATAGGTPPSPGYQSSPGYQAPPGYQATPGYQAPPGYQSSPGYQATPGYQVPPGSPAPAYGAPGFPNGYQQSAPPPRPPRRNNAWVIAAIVVVLLVAGGVTAFLLVGKSDNPQAGPSPLPSTSVPRTKPTPTVAALQRAVATDAETFLHALGNDEPNVFCPLWEPNNLQADLTAYNISSCQVLQLSSTDTKRLYSTIRVSDLSAIRINGDTALIPNTAFTPEKATDLKMVRGSGGHWLAAFYNASSTPIGPSSVPLDSRTGVAPPAGAETKSALLARFEAAKSARCPDLLGLTPGDAGLCRIVKPLISRAYESPDITFYGTGGNISFGAHGKGVVNLAIVLAPDNLWEVVYYEFNEYEKATDTLSSDVWQEPEQAITEAYRTDNCTLFARYFDGQHTDNPPASFCRSLEASTIKPYFANDSSLTPAYQGGNSLFGFYAFAKSDGGTITMVFVQSPATVRTSSTDYVYAGGFPSP